MKFGAWRAKHYFVILAAVALAYLVPGMFYWAGTRPDYAKCLWGDPGCSLTLATYLLTFVTGCAFIAAFQAAWFAFKTYEVGQETLDVASQTLQLERTAILGVQQCKERQHIAVTDIMLHSTFEREFRVPSVDEKTSYYEMAFEFSSLGRTPAVDVRVSAQFVFVTRLTGEQRHVKMVAEIALGNFKANGEAHVTIWIAPELLDVVSVQWLPATATHMVSEKPAKLEFHPLGAERPEFRGIASYFRTIGELPLEAPAPVEVPTPMPSTPTE